MRRQWLLEFSDAYTAHYKCPLVHMDFQIARRLSSHADIFYHRLNDIITIAAFGRARTDDYSALPWDGS
jgi:hypothetical protein